MNKSDLEKHAVELAELLSTHVRRDMVFVLLLAEQAADGGHVCVSALGPELTAYLLKSALGEVETGPPNRPPRSTRH
jgi:hypothetical protein